VPMIGAVWPPAVHFYRNAVFRPQCSALPRLRCHQRNRNRAVISTRISVCWNGSRADPDAREVALERSITHRLGRCADLSFVW
jgi:hypothetical protein